MTNKIGTIIFKFDFKNLWNWNKSTEFQFADVSCLICGYKNQYCFYQDYMSVVLTQNNYVWF